MANGTTTDAQSTKVKTGKVRLTYVSVFTPRSMDDDDTKDKKYQTGILIPKTDKIQIKAINAAIEAAKEIGKGKSWGGKIPKNLKMPLRDGDVEKEDDAYKGHYFLTASSKTKPGVIDLMKKEIKDPNDLYSGCYARVAINFYPFSVKGNNGIAAGLQNIQKLQEGEPLAGVRLNPVDEFDDDFELEDEDEDYNDLV